MKDNYMPWSIDHSGYYSLTDKKDKLKFLLNFAVLAPSSHNSQPWKFRIEEDEIILSPDRTRALPKSDKNERQLYISLGAALQNLITAADYYGYSVDVLYQPNGYTDAAAVVKLIEVADSKPADEQIIKSIVSRHSNRNKYSTKSLPDKFLNWVKSLSDENFKIYLVSDRKIKNKVADVVSDALIEAMDDSDFRSELSGYIKSNTTKAKVGMPMFGFGMPTPLSYLAPFILGRFNINKLSRSQDEALLKEHTPYFVIISSVNDDVESWIKSGQIYESIALMAEREGIKTAPQAAAIQIGDNYKRLQAIFKTDMRPQVFFRMGYSDSVVHHSPRLSVEDVFKKE